MKAFKWFIPMLLLTAATSQSFTNPDPRDTHYLIIVADLSHPGFLSTGTIYLSINGQEYRKERVPSSEVEGKYDYSYLIGLIKKYNQQGWKLFKSDLSVVAEKPRESGHIFIMMTRKNPYGIDRTPIDTIYQDASSIAPDNPAARFTNNVPQRQ